MHRFESWSAFSAKMKYLPTKLLETGLGLLSFCAPKNLFNYCIENNAGDSFNKYFIKAMFKVSIRKYSFGRKDHFLFCGSILGRSNNNSIVIGAGLISNELGNKIQYKEVIGVRGRLTLEILRSSGFVGRCEFLGDPGLLIREIVAPNVSVLDKGPVGIIPHFVDAKLVSEILANNEEYFVIDIRQSPFDVCEQIKLCKMILSSSLHGLIFSDAMCVPNAWISFGGALKGGRFKFHDYYSATNTPNKAPVYCKSLLDLKLAEACADISINDGYGQMRDVVYECFNARLT